MPAQAGIQFAAKACDDSDAMRPFFVYMLASRRNGTLYVGHTDELVRRTLQHKQRAFRGFTAKYGIDKLVWYEAHDTRESAQTRERQIKKWNRAWKLRLIEEMNPEWRDLYEEGPLW